MDPKSSRPDRLAGGYPTEIDYEELDRLAKETIYRGPPSKTIIVTPPPEYLARASIPANRSRSPGYYTSTPVYGYYPHVIEGAILVNPESIKDSHDPRSDSLNAPLRLENRGPPVVAVLVQGGVVVAFNHSQPFPQNFIQLGPHIIATISGGKVENCEMLLKELRANLRSHDGRNVSFKEALQWMTDILSSRSEVGLIAGWDEARDCPAVYRVDGMGGLMKGDILATGSGFRLVYSSLDLRSQIGLKKDALRRLPPSKSLLDVVLDDPSLFEEYSSWSAWKVQEAARMTLWALCWVSEPRNSFDFVSVCVVGREGLQSLVMDIPVRKVNLKNLPRIRMG